VAPLPFSVEQIAQMFFSGQSCREPLPPVEAMTSGTLASADGESHDPQDQQDDRGNPQEMYGEPGTEEDQDEQQCENEQHETRLLFN
jgi:hypothetical protein